MVLGPLLFVFLSVCPSVCFELNNQIKQKRKKWDNCSCKWVVRSPLPVNESTWPDLKIGDVAIPSRDVVGYLRDLDNKRKPPPPSTFRGGLPVHATLRNTDGQPKSIKVILSCDLHVRFVALFTQQLGAKVFPRTFQDMYEVVKRAWHPPPILPESYFASVAINEVVCRACNQGFTTRRFSAHQKYCTEKTDVIVNNGDCDQCDWTFQKGRKQERRLLDTKAYADDGPEFRSSLEERSATHKKTHDEPIKSLDVEKIEKMRKTGGDDISYEEARDYYNSTPAKRKDPSRLAYYTAIGKKKMWFAKRRSRIQFSLVLKNFNKDALLVNLKNLQLKDPGRGMVTAVKGLSSKGGGGTAGNLSQQWKRYSARDELLRLQTKSKSNAKASTFKNCHEDSVIYTKW